MVGALLLGGIVAAPLAAFVVRLLPTRILGTAVGGVILLVNMQTFFEAIGVTGTAATCLLLPDPRGVGGGHGLRDHGDSPGPRRWDGGPAGLTL